MKKAILINLMAVATFFTACNEANVKTENVEKKPKKVEIKKEEIAKIPVLNLATFHMGYTSDAHSVEFDENDEKNVKEVHEIAKKIADFKPTIILVEDLSKHDSVMNVNFENYKKDPSLRFKNPNEIELLAFEVGRLAGVEKIYGIDHKMGYNYMIGTEIENKIDPEMHDNYYKNPFGFYATDLNFDSKNIPLMEKFKRGNTEEYLDFLITVNADMLTHVGTEDSFEGADEAAILYKRNLRMYSNMNRIPITKEDRVFVLMGGSHTAFFRDFLSRSPKYKMVDTFEYLK
ncbi:DUF5694 domain-containing protein [Aureivirga sp. CE67]|uniref:DUF5694 domain-containing protein n=1 Tax=Aureivirga sp. CE67 TaxID=1788983 RepID=UPI0018CB47DB|nr:DUF5694 domain-containing protein [Aureivirga sp. CE67]